MSAHIIEHHPVTLTTKPPTNALLRFGGERFNVTDHRDTLLVFVTNGCVPVDNNASERQLRGPVVGRKNWMFAGSEGGAKTAATCFTIIGSCALVGINPYDYLRDVLRSRAIWHGLLPDATPSTLGTLTPRAWTERLGPKAP